LEIIKKKERKALYYMKYICDVCGWEFDGKMCDPDHGIDVSVAFDDLPDDFQCPLCGVGKDQFSPVE
jgi:rubredoxin-NAD+ reductase